MKQRLIIFICCAAIFAVCKKTADITPPLQSFADFIKNTEWVGTADRNGFEYPPPCALKFNGDNTFTMYSHFVFFPNGVETRTDSITGNIQSIDVLSNSVTRITTNINTTFRAVTTNYIDVADRKKIVGMSSDAIEPPTFQMDIFPTNGISVYGTHWKGPEWHSTVTDKSYAYPDLDNIHFQADGINTTYTFNGQPVYLSQNTPLQHVYQQNGSRIYMSGYNFLPGGAAISVNNYFGVLLSSGDKMLVDSYTFEARLPNYLYTNEPYGPNGVTPAIYKY